MSEFIISAFSDEASSNIDEQIIALKKNGLAGMEIRNVDGENIADISLQKAKEVKEKMDKAGLFVWSIGSPIGKIEPEKNEEHIEKFKTVLKIADILGAKYIRLFSLFLKDESEAEELYPITVKFLKELVKLADGSGITLCHENEKGIFGDTAERCLAIKQAVPELELIFDPANFVQCKVDTKKAWELLGKEIKYLHIKDALADGSVVPAGKGIGNVKYILDEYRKLGGKNATLEPHLAVFDGLAALENEDDKSVVGEVYSYASNEEAFDAAANALKELL